MQKVGLDYVLLAITKATLIGVAKESSIMDDITSQPDVTIDPYATLGILETASPAEVKAAYRSLALKNHPGKLK